MTNVSSWQNSISLCPVSFCIPRPNLPVTPGVSWLPTFAFQSPIMKRTSFGGVSSKCLVCLIELLYFSFFSFSGQGIDLDYHDIEWFALEMNRDHSVIFDIASRYCISGSFVDYDGYSISSKGLLPTGVDTVVIRYREWMLCEKEETERIRDGQRKPESIVPVLSPSGEKNRHSLHLR